MQGGSARSGTPISSGGSPRERQGWEGVGACGGLGCIEVVPLCGVLPREFLGARVVLSVPSSGGLVVLGEKVTSGVDPGTQTIPAAHRSTTGAGTGAGIVQRVFHTRVPTCDGNNLQMLFGDPAVRGHVGCCPAGGLVWERRQAGMEIWDKGCARCGLSG